MASHYIQQILGELLQPVPSVGGGIWARDVLAHVQAVVPPQISRLIGLVMSLQRMAAALPSWKQACTGRCILGAA